MIFQNEGDISKCKFKHILEVLDIGEKNKKRLGENNINNFENLKAAKERLGCNGLFNVKEQVQIDLFDVICYIIITENNFIRLYRIHNIILIIL